MAEKTKATLYLEKDVVNRAKESDLNMSEIANNALKERFGLERETSRQRNLRVLLQDAMEEDRLYSLPFSVTRIEIENIRKFDELSLDFEEGLNVVYGPNGSGKSTVIETIVNTVTPGLGEVEKDFIKHDRNSGQARIELDEDMVTRRFTPGRWFGEGENGVLLLDTPFFHLDDEHTVDLLKQLKDTVSSQIILTTTNRELTEYADNSIRLRTFTEERKQDLEEDIEALEDESEEKNERLIEVTTEIKDLEMHLEDLQASKYRIENFQDERAEIQDSIDELEMEVEELEEEIASVEDQLEKSDSEREIGRLEERREHLSERSAEKQDRLQEYYNELEEIEEEVKRMEEIEDETHDFRSKIEHKRNLKHELEGEIEELHNELTVLKQERKEIESKMEVAR